MLQIRTVVGLWLEELILRYSKITRNTKGQDSRAFGQVLYCIAEQQSAKRCGPGTRTDTEEQNRMEKLKYRPMSRGNGVCDERGISNQGTLEDRLFNKWFWDN